MTTTLITFAIVYTLWIFSDRITESLSNGKSFAPNETKW